MISRQPHGPVMPKPLSSDKSPETLRAIESLLLWEGAAGNERVRELFGLHFTSASRLLSQYAALNPIGLSYSTAQRRWEADDDFKPCLTSGSVEEYLARTAAQNPDSTPVVRTRLDFGAVKPRAFAVLHRAAREGLGVTAKHRSMRRPAPSIKTIYPHVLVEAGRRWHVRAYVAEAGTFQDLALTRLSELALADFARPEEAAPEHDVAWTTQVDVRIVPHPNLTPEQKQMVRAEYFGRAAARVETMREALVPYLVHELRAATDPIKQPPPEFQLYVDNRGALNRWLLPDPLAPECST